MPSGTLLAFNSLCDEFQLPFRMFFCYLQLRHAVQAQFPNGVSLKSHGVESFLISNNVDRILSSLYLRISSEESSSGTKLFQKWKTDFPALEDVDWVEGIQQYIPLMISAKERYIQLKFIHRAYYTPQEALSLTLLMRDYFCHWRQQWETVAPTDTLMGHYSSNTVDGALFNPLTLLTGHDS